MGIVERAVQIAESNVKEGESPHVPSVASSSEPKHTVDSAASLQRSDSVLAVQVDLERLRELGRLPSLEAAPRTEDEFRRIKWPLLRAITGTSIEPPVRNNVILVTSALPGEGKTFVALNLALSVVRDRELDVILVDADVARPGLTPALGLDDAPGLNDVLEDSSRDIHSVIYRTNVDGLYVVPAGKWNDRAPEFFAGSRMPQVINELSRRVGKGAVLLDSPPLLATNEAQLVTRHAAQVLFVVKADATEQRIVREAIALVDPAASTNAVLNQVRPSLFSTYYGQHEYQYGSGYGDDRPAPQLGARFDK